MFNADLILIRPNGKHIVYTGVKQGATAVDPPYWLAAMGGFLRDKNVNVSLIDAEAAGYTPEETAEVIDNMNPKLVGVFTLGSNLTASTWAMPGASNLCSAIKTKNPEIPLFLWGNHVSALPERTLREEAVDYVVIGEGFDAVYSLFQFVVDGSPQRDSIQGVQYLENNKLLGDGHVSTIKDINTIPVDGWDLIPETQRNYRNHMHFAFEDLSKRDFYGAILTSLGCPYGCSYCAIRTFSGNTRKMRYKTIDNAIKEVDWWVNNRNVYYLRILDECFTADRKFAIDFSNALKARNYNLSLWINARIDLVDEELLTIMRSAGIKWVGYGIESGSTRIRKIAHKQQYDYTKIKEVVDLTHKCGLHICGNLMFGLPGENKDDMLADIEMLRELRVDYPNLYCTMAYPGSPLYDDILSKNPDWLPKEWAGYAQLSYETTPLPTEYLTSGEILDFRDRAFNMYFTDNKPYFDMINNKFGQLAVDAINNMLNAKIKRKILGD